jgi:hypothetical protein
VRLVEELRQGGDQAALRRMRLFCSGSAPLAPETFAAFRELASFPGVREAAVVGDENSTARGLTIETLSLYLLYPLRGEHIMSFQDLNPTHQRQILSVALTGRRIEPSCGKGKGP